MTGIVVVKSLVFCFLVHFVRSQDETSEAPPAAGGGGGGPGGPLAGGGGGINGDKELIFPNLPTWKNNLSQRSEVLNKSIEIAATDDEESKKAKFAAQQSMKEIGFRLFDPKLMDNKNQRIIAGQLADLEEKFSNAGRKLFGIKWNSIPCGAGFVQANCGSLLPCSPA